MNNRDFNGSILNIQVNYHLSIVIRTIPNSNTFKPHSSPNSLHKRHGDSTAVHPSPVAYPHPHHPVTTTTPTVETITVETTETAITAHHHETTEAVHHTQIVATAATEEDPVPVLAKEAVTKIVALMALHEAVMAVEEITNAIVIIALVLLLLLLAQEVGREIEDTETRPLLPLLVVLVGIMMTVVEEIMVLEEAMPLLLHPLLLANAVALRDRDLPLLCELVGE